MKKTLIIFLISLFTGGIAISQQAYTMYQTMYITPKKGLENVFKENLMAHIKKYHSAAPYEVRARYVVFGKHEEQFVWVQGPTTYTQMDNMSRPDSTAHMADWSLNVEPYIEETCTNELWKRKDDLSYIPEGGTSNLKLQLIRFYEVKPGKWETFMGLMKNVAEVCKTNKYKDSWQIYVNQFDADNGRDVAAVNGFPNWAYFETDTWVADYEKLYGKDSWKTAMNTFYECISEYQEEIRENL